jgi:hypothetical protein
MCDFQKQKNHIQNKRLKLFYQYPRDNKMLDRKSNPTSLRLSPSVEKWDG